GGLAFWVLVDRSLDIGTLSWRGIPCAWQGPNGFRAPWLHDAEAEQGQGFLRSFGGLLVTCGLGHTRQPAEGRPLHGRLPFTPARLTGYGEVWDTDAPHLFCEGEVVDAVAGGERWVLARRIEAPIGGSSIRIVDRVRNAAFAPRPQPILYHFNLGFPLVAPESRVALDDRPLDLDLASLGRAEPARVTCRRAAAAAGWSRCEVRSRHATLAIGFDTTTLPWLQTWLDPAPGMHVLGIEPCNSDRAADGRNVAEPALDLAPGAGRIYRLEIALAEPAPGPDERPSGTGPT
ncbi:MAG TPA: DUF4432 family protein, partial [Geminicoccaceae bacterium]|nr:DUF4432 family protein [Geminicoccaceae bacterium]